MKGGMCTEEATTNGHQPECVHHSSSASNTHSFIWSLFSSCMLPFPEHGWHLLNQSSLRSSLISLPGKLFLILQERRACQIHCQWDSELWHNLWNQNPGFPLSASHQLHRVNHHSSARGHNAIFPTQRIKHTR